MADDILDVYAKDAKLNGLKKDGSKIRVMIVDDSLAFRRLLKRVFDLTGYEVLAEISDGNDAILKYSTLKPDIVTMDVTMPEMEGTVAVDAIRRNHPDAKIIMVSSLGHKDLVEEAIKKGAKGYVLKPITDATIPKVLETIKKIAMGD